MKPHPLVAWVRERAMRAPRWVFMGPNGVGKGTYASQLATLLGLVHVATGDLLRAELASGAPRAAQVQELTTSGQLIPDAIMLAMLRHRLRQDDVRSCGFILDGFPRTVAQAEHLQQDIEVDMVLNMSLCEEALVAKCEGRRICDECGRGFNLADVNLPARPAAPAIVMPPMPAPAACTHKLVIRADDAPKVVRRRLAHFHEQIAPLRSHFAARGLLVDYEVLGGMEHTTPRLMDAILSHVVTAAAKGPYENGVKKRMESDNMKINPMGGIH